MTITRLKRVGIAALTLFTLHALSHLEAGAPDGPGLVLIAAAILWLLVLVPAFRRPRRTR